MRLTIDKNALIKRLLALGLPATLIAAPVALQGQAIEWEPDEGYHEEEWYDPSDWFDDDSAIDYEQDYGDYYYYGPYWDSVTWYETYDYTDEEDFTDEEDLEYGVHYEWDADANEWVQDYGAYREAYSYNVNFGDARNTEGVWPNDATLGDEQNQQETQDQQSDEDMSASAKQSWEDDQQAGMSSEEKTLTGTIEGFRKINLEYPAGFEETHQLARINIEDGETAVIDLGYASLVDADLEKGEQVTLRGSDGMINGQRVFVVTQLVTGDNETVFIDRALALERSQKSDKQKSDKQMMTLEGQLEDHTEVNIEGKDQTFVKLRLQNGEAATVALGENISLEDLDLEEGAQIRVRGERQKLEDRTVLAAQSISVAGEQVTGSQSG